MKTGLRLLSLSALVSAGAAQADDGALSRSFAIPVLGQTEVIAPDRGRSRFELDLTNEYLAQSTATESVSLDGETLRIGLTYQGSLAPGWDFNFEIPLYVLGGGFLDSFISGYHDLTGLPNGGRDQATNDQYRYRYTRGGAVLLDARESGAFTGDMSIGLGWQALSGVALRAMVKLPTGDGRKLTGGNAGAAVWADAALPFDAAGAFSAYVSAGVSVNERGDVLGDLQEQTLFFGGGGLRYRFTSAFSAYADLTARGSYFKGSTLDPLDGAGVPALFGVSLDFGDRQALDLAFQEDLNPGASPDFGLRLVWRQR